MESEKKLKELQKKSEALKEKLMLREKEVQENVKKIAEYSKIADLLHSYIPEKKVRRHVYKYRLN